MIYYQFTGIITLLAILIFIENKKSNKIIANGIMFIVVIQSMIVLLCILIGTLFNEEEQLAVIMVGLSTFVLGLLHVRGTFDSLAIRYEDISYFVVLTQMISLVYFVLQIVMHTFTHLNLGYQVIFFITNVLIFAINLYLLNKIKNSLDFESVKRNKERIKEDIIPMIQQVRILQHEYAHLLGGLTHQQNVDEIYKSSVFHQKHDNQFDAFGKTMPMLRASLYMKYKQLKEVDIHLITYTWLDVMDFYIIKPREYEIVTILINLVENARDAILAKRKEEKKAHNERLSDESCKIIVKIEIQEAVIKLSVGNSGHTILEENFEKWQSLGYTTKKEENHGYGLHIVARICRKYGGVLTIEEMDAMKYITVTM